MLAHVAVGKWALALQAAALKGTVKQSSLAVDTGESFERNAMRVVRAQETVTHMKRSLFFLLIHFLSFFPSLLLSFFLSILFVV